MEKLSLIKKFDILFNIIKTSPFFITIFIIGLLLSILMIINFKKTKKIKDKILIIIWILTTLLIIYKYYNYLLKLSDNLVEEVISAIYFPNLAIYIIIIITTNISLIISLLKKEINTSYKFVNILATIILNFLFILTIEIIIKNNINVYKELTIYSNKKLLTLIELSSGTYTIWLFSIGFINLVEKTIPKNIKETKKTPIKNTNIIYEAPKVNMYDNNNSIPTNVSNDESLNYTNIFEQNNIPIIAHEDILNNIQIQKKEKKKEPRLSYFKKKKSVDLYRNQTYRVPLFESLNEDALLNCIVPINQDNEIKKETNIVQNKINEKMLFDKFNSGEQLTIEQYKLLKEYIITKQGI